MLRLFFLVIVSTPLFGMEEIKIENAERTSLDTVRYRPPIPLILYDTWVFPSGLSTRISYDASKATIDLNTGYYKNPELVFKKESPVCNFKNTSFAKFTIDFPRRWVVAIYERQHPNDSLVLYQPKSLLEENEKEEEENVGFYSAPRLKFSKKDFQFLDAVLYKTKGSYNNLPEQDMLFLDATTQNNHWHKHILRIICSVDPLQFLTSAYKE